MESAVLASCSASRAVEQLQPGFAAGPQPASGIRHKDSYLQLSCPCAVGIFRDFRKTVLDGVIYVQSIQCPDPQSRAVLAYD